MTIPRVKYKQPRRINVVSLALLAVGVAVAYAAFCIWPVLALRVRVKNEIAEVLPELCRINLRPNAHLQEARLRQEIAARVQRVGLEEATQIVIDRDGKLVAIEVHFTAVASFPLIDYQHAFTFAPRVETDAERVDW